MHCPNCGAELKGRFCSECGAKARDDYENISQEKLLTQHIWRTSTPNDAILVRSQNCISTIEDNKKESEKRASQLLTIAGVIGIITMFSPYLFTVLDGKKLSQAEGPPLPVVFLVLAMIIVAWIATVKQAKASRELYNKYKEYCSIEILIVDATKIYGSTTKGTISLTFDQIAEVQFMPNAWPSTGRKTVIANDIFTVRDVVGNEFIFYSFSNGKDLKAVIDMQIRGIRDGKVQ